MELVERAPGYFIQRLTAKDSNGKMPIMQKDFSRAVFQELQDSAPTVVLGTTPFAKLLQRINHLFPKLLPTSDTAVVQAA